MYPLPLNHVQGAPLFSFKTQGGASKQAYAANFQELQDAVASKSQGFLFSMDLGDLTLTPSGWTRLSAVWAAQLDKTLLDLDVEYTLAPAGAHLSHLHPFLCMWASVPHASPQTRGNQQATWQGVTHVATSAANGVHGLP